MPVRIKKTAVLNEDNVITYNPVQIAAISNFKLAQLTFAPPDLHSLRKTAIVKNMLERVYSNTPPTRLQQMTRWQFFTPESLEKMTQEGLEEIFAQYAQTIEAFRTAKPDTVYVLEKDEIFGGENSLWEDQLETDEDKNSKGTQSTGSSSSIFSQPNMTISAESLEARGSSPLSDKPLPASPAASDDVAKQARRKSSFGGNKNRLSWTSDTGLTSSVVSQNLANQIMSLFDMDFAVDIKINTAPKLPELPFKVSQDNRVSNKTSSVESSSRAKEQRRVSQDMLTSLLPAFEKIAFDNSFARSQLNKNLDQDLRQKQTTVIQSVPKRSSSLKHRQECSRSRSPARSRTIDDYSSQSKKLSSSSGMESTDRDLTRKDSLLKFASMVTGNKKQEPNTVSSNPVYMDPEPKVFSIRDKPLPEPPRSPDILPIRENSLYVNKKSKVLTRKKRKSMVIMEKTAHKRKSTQLLQSIYDADIVEKSNRPGLTRSKSAFIKLGGGLKPKKSTKYVRKTSSANDFNSESTFNYKKSDNFYGPVEPSNHNFVKRMASFMKSRASRPVET